MIVWDHTCIYTIQETVSVGFHTNINYSLNIFLQIFSFIGLVYLLPSNNAFEWKRIELCNLKRQQCRILKDVICYYLKIRTQHNIYSDFYVWVSVHHKLMYIKRTNVMQLGSMFICNCNITVHVSDAFCVHLQEHLETVEAASGEWHETGWGIQQGVQGRWHPH